MKQILLQTGCESITGNNAIKLNETSSGSLLAAIIRGCIALNETSVPFYVDIVEPPRNTSETDSGAVMYIVAVLVFYSAGIVTMIIKYLKREKRELEEEKALEDFFRSMPAYHKEREQKNVNKMAIHAFHALTSFSYDDEDDVSVSSGIEDNDMRMCPETIHEVDDHTQTVHDKQMTASAAAADVEDVVFSHEHGVFEDVDEDTKANEASNNV